MNNLADMMIETYVAESNLLRVQKIEKLKGADCAAIYKDILDVCIYDCADLLRKAGLEAVYSFASYESAKDLANAITTLTKVCGVNVKEARRRIADKLIADNTYKF